MSDILVINGNPNPTAFGAKLADAYLHSATGGGATVEVVQLHELEFDPVLHRGYELIQPLERDLQAMQEKIERARHVVWIFPMWWVGLPALMKGFIDRTFLPGWAFSYEGGPLPAKLLKGRSARVIVTMDSPRWWYWLGYGLAVWRSFNIGTLWFSGFAPVRSTNLFRLHDASEAEKNAMVARVGAAASKDVGDLSARRPSQLLATG